MGVIRDLAGSFEPVIVFSVALGVASLIVSLLMAEMKIGDRPEPAAQA
jgi:cyanate permease